jgi:copper chaperone CopZ
MRLLIAFLFLLVACDSTPPPQTVLTLSIEGMHCNSCVQSITAEIDKIDGVTSCVVTLEENNAVVTVTDEALAQTILQNIRRLQFSVELAGQQQIDPAREYQ